MDIGNVFHPVFDPVFSVRLLETLCHFLWQGAAVALLLAGAWPLLRRAAAATRYHVLVAGLLVMAACPVVTFVLLPGPAAPNVVVAAPEPVVRVAADSATIDGGSGAGPVEEVDSPAPVRSAAARGGSDVTTRPVTQPAMAAGASTPAPPLPAAAPPTHRIYAGRYAPYAAGIYAAGVLAFLARLLLALAGGHRLRRSARPVDDVNLLAAVRRIARELGLRVVPKLAYCARLVEPAVVGVLRPTILLPVALVSGLTPGQVEAVLAHELAHVRRWDHWVNVIQRIIEAFLFFHPAVWLVSNRIRREREHCCDDLAAACAGGGKETAMDRVGYADSIVRAAELIRTARRPSRDRYPVASVAATGSGNPSHLRTRVLRLLDPSFREELPMGRGAAAALVVGLVAVFALAIRIPARAGGPAPEGGAGAVAVPATRPATGPAAAPARAAQAALQRLRPHLPTGWSLRAKEGVLSIRRDKGLQSAHVAVPGSQLATRYPYRIDLRFEEPMAVEEFRRRLAEQRRAREIVAEAGGPGRGQLFAAPKADDIRAANPVPDLFDVEGGSGHGVYVSIHTRPHQDGAEGHGASPAGAGYGAPGSGAPGGGAGGFYPGGAADPEEVAEVERVRRQVLGFFRRDPAGARPWVDRLRSLGPYAVIGLTWVPPADLPRPQVTGVSLGEQHQTQAVQEQRHAQLKAEDTSRLIELLAERGFFDRAKDPSDPAAEAIRATTRDAGKSELFISVFGYDPHSGDARVSLEERLPLDEKAIGRMREIAKTIGGDPAAAIGALLEEIESYTEPWVPASGGPAVPKPGAPPRSAAPWHRQHARHARTGRATSLTFLPRRPWRRRPK